MISTRAAGVVASSALLWLAADARAQIAAAPPAVEPVLEAPDSPRASVRSFLELTTRKGDFRGAARYLTLPTGEEARGPLLARRLAAVLERQLDVDLDALSPPTGPSSRFPTANWRTCASRSSPRATASDWL